MRFALNRDRSSSAPGGGPRECLFLAQPNSSTGQGPAARCGCDTMAGRRLTSGRFRSRQATCWSATCWTSTSRIPSRADIDITVAAVVKDIERHARKVQSSDEIAQVGTISANGDRAIGKMIAEAMKRVSNEGVITVEEAQTAETELSTSSRGCSLSSPYFIISAEKMVAEAADSRGAVLTSKQLLIVAEDIERRRHRSGRRRGLAARQGRGRQAQGR
jgi:hypothetical protein